MKTKEKNKPAFEFLENNLAQSIERKFSTLSEIDKENYFEINEIAGKLFRNLLIFIGVFLTFASSLVIFHWFIDSASKISNPLLLFFIFIIGLFFMILGVGKVKEKSHWLLYASIPILNIFLGTIFILAPSSWKGFLFGSFSLLVFPLVLFGFYQLKDVTDRIYK